MGGRHLRWGIALYCSSLAAGAGNCDIYSGCFWDAPMGRCACPGDSSTHINLKHLSYNAAAEVTTFSYGVACPHYAGNISAWGLHTEPDLVIVSDASSEWTKEYSQGRHSIATFAMVQCPGEMTFEFTLQGKLGTCLGQSFSASSTGEGLRVLSPAAVPCSYAAKGVQLAVVKDAADGVSLTGAAAAASSVAAPVPAGRLHSTTETVTRSSAWEVASLKLQHAPASQSPSPATTLQSAMGQLDGIEEGLQSSYRCAELGEKLKKLREASHGLAQEFGHMAFQGSAPESADVAVEVSKRVVEVFLVGVKRWETNVWCPRGVQGAMRIMQVASEDWTRTFAALGEHGLHSSVQAAQAWADGLTTAGRTWIAMAQRTTCQQIPMMVSILNQIVTLASTSVASWVALTEAFTGNEAAKLEVMSVWMTAFETLTEDARSGALAWSDVCANQKSTLDQIDAASIALSQFVRHFSTQLATASRQWARAFGQTGASASAVVHASLLASSSFYVSDLAQISHTWATTWALRAATGTAVQQASQKWADAFQVVMADAAEKASAWHSACKDCSGDSDDAWMSFFEMISVSVDVAAEGWRHSVAHVADGEHAVGGWDTVQKQLVQAAEQVTQAWNHPKDLPSASAVASVAEDPAVRIVRQDELQVQRGTPAGLDFVIRELDASSWNASSTCAECSSNISILSP